MMPTKFQVYERLLGCHKTDVDGNYPQVPGVLQVAEAMHGSLCGSSDWNPDIDKAAAALQYRLDSWELSLGGSEEFDNAVKTVLKAAVNEYHLNIENNASV